MGWLCVCVVWFRLCSLFFFFSSRRRHTRWTGDWSSDVCSSDLDRAVRLDVRPVRQAHAFAVGLPALEVAVDPVEVDDGRRSVELVHGHYRIAVHPYAWSWDLEAVVLVPVLALAYA